MYERAREHLTGGREAFPDVWEWLRCLPDARVWS